MLPRNHGLLLALLAGLLLLYYAGLPRRLSLRYDDGILPSLSNQKEDNPKESYVNGVFGVIAEGEGETEENKLQGPGDSSPAAEEHGHGHEDNHYGGDDKGHKMEDQSKNKENDQDKEKGTVTSSERPEPSDDKMEHQEEVKKPKAKPKEKEGDKKEHEDGEETDDKGKEHPASYKNGETLRTLCSSTSWTEGLWLQCHSWSGPNGTSITGGLNNARNRVQTCIRLAIDAGAGLILPTVATQRYNQNPMGFNQGQAVCSDVYWDVDFLEKEMKSKCPDFAFRRCGDIEGIEKVIQGPHRSYESDYQHRGTFKTLMHSGLEEEKSIASKEHPVAYGYGDTFMAYNYTESEELSLRKDLFNVLRFNHDLLGIGTSILNSPQLQDGFIGVHLRGETDWPDEFGSRDQQMELFEKEIEEIHASKNAPKTIYISCGDPQAIHAFNQRLESKGFIVHNKWSLTGDKPELNERVKELEFDLAAIIEYQVMVEANMFLGVWMSTFSLLVAYARSANKPEDFYSTYVVTGSRREENRRIWEVTPALKGDETSKLMVVNAGPGLDVMDGFP